LHVESSDQATLMTQYSSPVLSGAFQCEGGGSFKGNVTCGDTMAARGFIVASPSGAYRNDWRYHQFHSYSSDSSVLACYTNWGRYSIAISNDDIYLRINSYALRIGVGAAGLYINDWGPLTQQDVTIDGTAYELLGKLA